MKTLTEIKKVLCFNRLVLFVVALGLITTFTACSNDDDSDIPVYSLKDVDGNYSGTMLTKSDPPVNPQTNSPKEEQPEGATVTAEVKDNQVMIKKLPELSLRIWAISITTFLIPLPLMMTVKDPFYFN